MLDANKLAQELDDNLQDFIENQDINNQTLFLNNFAKILDDNFQLATPTLNNIDIKPAKGTLAIPSSGSSPANATIIATAISNYFAMCVTPTGIPQVGVITLVMNTASTIIPTLTADILSLIGKNKSVGYSEFSEKVINSIKSITWNVTETLPNGVTVPFPNITLN